MSISTGTISLPRRVESIATRYQGPISLDTLDGKLANHIAPGGQGAVFVDFTKARPDMPPRSGMGSLVLYDGASQPILDCSDQFIQIEQGAPDPAWRGVTVGDFVARGFDSSGRFFAFRKIGEDETSVLVEFALADAADRSGFLEVAKWVLG